MRLHVLVRFRSALGAIGIAASLGACTPQQPDGHEAAPDDDLARAVMEAAGFPRLDDPDHPAASLERQRGKQPFGRGPFNTAIGSLVMAFAPSSTLNQGQYGAVLAWVPEDQAATANDARALLLSRLEAAFSRALADTDLKGARYSFKAAADDQGRKARAVVLQGGPCDPAAPCGFSPFGSPTLELAKATAPAVLGSHRSWATLQTGNPPVLKPWTRTESDPATRFPEVEVYRRASALLPPWIVIYVAAGSASSCETPPACRWADRSFVLSSGQAHTF